MSKAPAFQFYAKDWLDMRVMRMSFEAQGVYMRLLAHMWADSETQFSIENNPKMLSRMIGLSVKKFQKIFAEIQWPGDPIFLEEDGFLVSKRLRKEKEKQVKISTKRREAADVRWGEQDANAHANAKQVQCKQDALQSSSSSSSSEIQEKDRIPPPIPPSDGAGVVYDFSLSQQEPDDAFDPSDMPSIDFEQFFDAFPKQVDKVKAWNAWRKLGRARPGLDFLLVAIDAQSQSDQWTRDHGRYIPSPAKWLQERKWLDKLSPAPTSPAAAQTSDTDWMRFAGSCVKQEAS